MAVMYFIKFVITDNLLYLHSLYRGLTLHSARLGVCLVCSCPILDVPHPNPTQNPIRHTSKFDVRTVWSQEMAASLKHTGLSLIYLFSLWPSVTAGKL